MFEAARPSLCACLRSRAPEGSLRATGKPFKLVLTACMRKLLTILNAMLKNNTRWIT